MGVVVHNWTLPNNSTIGFNRTHLTYVDGITMNTYKSPVPDSQHIDQGRLKNILSSSIENKNITINVTEKQAKIDVSYLLDGQISTLNFNLEQV